MSDAVMSDGAVTGIVVASSVIGYIWAAKNYNDTMSCQPNIGHGGVPNERTRLVQDSPGDIQRKNADMGQFVDDDDKESPENIKISVKRVSTAIQDGAKGFLVAEYQYMAVFIVLMSAILMIFLGLRKVDNSWANAGFTTIAFVVGSVTSIASGWIGMTIAVEANVRTACVAYDNRGNFGPPFVIAFKAGAVMGFALVSLGILNLYILVSLYKLYFDPADSDASRIMYECVAGYGLGGSSIALFGRVGGGIYTKAADVGADLFKLDGLEEDDPRNPAVIADNVGDNVGDIAGMGADLFGSFAESSCAAMVVSADSEDLFNNWAAMCFPMLVAACGLLVCLVTGLFATHLCTVTKKTDVGMALLRQLIISTVLMTPTCYALCHFSFPDEFHFPQVEHVVKPWYVFVCLVCGLWSGLFIGLITNYYTSNEYEPTLEIARESKLGAPANIIYGLALGYKSVIIPVICLGWTIFASYSLAGMYGVACGAIGILSTLATGLTIDAYGPICDNAGGIAEMCHMPESVRTVTDALDAAGNTTAAIGKGFAIGSAAMVSLALFGAFVTTKNAASTSETVVDILEAWVFFGLLIGAMLPYWFSAMTMKSVGAAANEMIEEVKRQFDPDSGLNLLGQNPNIPTGVPEYSKCVQISTVASLREMIPPGILVLVTPLVVGFFLGVKCLAGMLIGSLISGVQLAISASNTGGAWDNAKKEIESLDQEFLFKPDPRKEGDRQLTDREKQNQPKPWQIFTQQIRVHIDTKEEQMEGDRKPIYAAGKKSAQHGATVIGDTVGDPMKDTSGPSLNILIKLSAITSLVFGPAMAPWDQPGFIQKLFEHHTHHNNTAGMF